ncbi:Dihydrofolate reductase [bioreactor metagenome]|uniref:dihydrofolate reductase n=1 Tax=bioreactor metagenome TaxID=1076179 RepID=A0A644XP02_9ZZZZ
MKLIVAADRNWGIGCENRLLAHISPDLKRFRALTSGHPVLLGRKTLETFPGGRPLPGRRNLILSAAPGYAVEDGEVYPSLDAVLKAAPEDTFVIGGESVYRALLPFCDTAFVTKIMASFPADAFFPNLDKESDWELIQTEAMMEYGDLHFQYVTYQKVK